MYLANIIIQNFIEALEEEDLMRLSSLPDDEAFAHLVVLYEEHYGAEPSGVAIYLLRSKFKIGSEAQNRKYLPAL